MYALQRKIRDYNHEIRNACVSIAGILARVRFKPFSSAEIDVKDQLRRIENTLDAINKEPIYSCIEVKDTETLLSLAHEWHPKLRQLSTWLAERFGLIVITCGYEHRDYPSTHNVIPLRALDIRSWIYDAPEIVAANINRHWQYDPKRPEFLVALYHDVGRGNHIHCQVHDNTVKVRENDTT